MKCLLADPFPESLAIIKSMHLPGLRLHVCKTVDTVLFMYGTHYPDLILIDLDLPYPGGLNAIRKLRNLALENKKDPVIIACCKRSAGTIVQQSLQQGADDFVLKPFTSEMLAVRLKKHFPDLIFDA